MTLCRRTLLFALACAQARAAAAARAARIGYLVQAPLTEPPGPERVAFLDGLRALGLVPGQGVSIEYRSAEDQPDVLPDLARDLVAAGVDVIVATHAEAARAAAAVTRTTPIVFVAVPDPMAIGLVTGLARPGANVTGLAWESDDLTGKRIELLKQTLPQSRRLAVLRHPKHAEAQRRMSGLIGAARRMGLSIDEHLVEDAQGLAPAFAAIGRQRPDALYVLTDPHLVRLRQIIAGEALRLRLPSFFGFRGWVTAGGLMSYAADLPDLYRRAATYVDKILRGARPGELPVELPTKFLLTVNLKTAMALGIRIPQTVLLRADEVIQ